MRNHQLHCAAHGNAGGGWAPSPDKQSQQEAHGVDQQAAGGSRCGRCVLAGSEGLFAVGFVSLNSDICRFPFKPVPKDAGAAPASFGAGLKVIRQISEFSDTNPTANGLSDPARTHRPQQLPPACWSTPGASCWLCLSGEGALPPLHCPVLRSAADCAFSRLYSAECAQEFQIFPSPNNSGS